MESIVHISHWMTLNNSSYVMTKNNLGIKQERNEIAFRLKNNQMPNLYYCLIGINNYLLINNYYNIKITS